MRDLIDSLNLLEGRYWDNKDDFEKPDWDDDEYDDEDEGY